MLSRDCPPRDGPPRDCPSRPGPPLRESPSKDLAPEGRALERGDEGRALEGRPDEGRSFEGRPDEGRAGPRDGPASSRSPRYAGRSRRGAPLVPDVRDVRAAGAPGRAGRVGRPEPSEDDPPSVPVDRAGRADEDVRVVAFVRLAEAGRAGRPVVVRAGRAPFLGSSSSERHVPAALLGAAPFARPLGAPGRGGRPFPPPAPPPVAEPPRADGARRGGRGESAGISGSLGERGIRRIVNRSMEGRRPAGPAGRGPRTR